MKLVSSLFLTFAFTYPCLSQDLDWYVFGGLSLYDEDVQRHVGEGSDFRVGVGIQITELLGVEFDYKRAPELDSSSFSIDTGGLIDIEEIIVEPLPNTYLSILGTGTLLFNDNMSLIAKAGISAWTAGLNASLNGQDIGADDDGISLVVSGGLLFPFNKRSAFELAVTQNFGDAEALSLNGTFIYRF